MRDSDGDFTSIEIEFLAQAYVGYLCSTGTGLLSGFGTNPSWSGAIEPHEADEPTEAKLRSFQYSQTSDRIYKHMALGLTFSNGKPATMARGKYTTRNNRLVEIHGSHVETGTTGGVAWSKKMWDGTLYAANMRDVESTHSWSDEGGYLHQEGVGNEFDLRTVIEQIAEPEPAPALTQQDPALLSHMLEYSALVEKLAAVSEPGDANPLATLDRVIAERDAVGSVFDQNS